MTDSQIIEHLQALGLTEYESRAYLAAVRLGRATPGELSTESGVPQARIYDVIDSLQDEALVEVHTQSRRKEVTAPSPKTVLTQFKRRRIDELSEQVSTAVSDLEHVYHRPEENPDAYVTMVSREASALRHVRRAIETAEWWLTISIEERLYPEIRDEIVEALDRDVTVRLLLSEGDPDVESEDFPPDLRVRHRRTADTFVAADREYGVFSSKHPGRTGQPYIITQERNLVLLFQNYSNQVWPTSTVVQSGEPLARRYLDPWHLIIDLADHWTEEMDLYATVPGMSTRTYRQGTWEGRLVDFDLRGPVEGADYTISTPVVASVTLETDDGELTVGGWKATIEDVAADGIELTDL